MSQQEFNFWASGTGAEVYQCLWKRRVEWSSHERATAELQLALCWAGTEMDLLTIVSAAYPLSQNGVLENALILNSRSLNAFSSICDTCLHSKGCGIPFLQWGQARFASDLPMGWQNASPNCCPSTCQLIFLSLRHDGIICHPFIN